MKKKVNGLRIIWLFCTETHCKISKIQFIINYQRICSHSHDSSSCRQKREGEQFIWRGFKINSFCLIIKSENSFQFFFLQLFKKKLIWKSLIVEIQMPAKWRRFSFLLLGLFMPMGPQRSLGVVYMRGLKYICYRNKLEWNLLVM